MPFDASPVDSEVVTVLKKARALIDSPEKWCKGNYGHGTDGPYCGVGALWHVTRVTGILPFLNLAAAETGRAAYFSEFNDLPETTHAEVLQAFDRAIILAGGTP